MRPQVLLGELGVILQALGSHRGRLVGRLGLTDLGGELVDGIELAPDV